MLSHGFEPFSLRYGGQAITLHLFFRSASGDARAARTARVKKIII